jgi:Putative zinc-finger
MDCREAEKIISLYLDNEFSSNDNIELEEHISKCSRCSNLLEEERELKTYINQIKLQRAPDDLRLSISNMIGKESKSIQFHNFFKLGFGFTTAAVVLSLGIYFYSTNIDPNEKPMNNPKCMIAQKYNKTELYKNTEYKNRTIKKGYNLKNIKLAKNVNNRFRRRRLSPIFVENSLIEHYKPFGNANKSKIKFHKNNRVLNTSPPKFASWGANIVGKRLNKFYGQDAIQIIYKINQRKVTLFMFNLRVNPDVIKIENINDLKNISDDSYITETPGGRIVALFSHNNVGYSIILDQNKKVMLNLIKAIIKK